MTPGRDPMQKPARYEPTCAHDTIFDGFSNPRGMWARPAPRTARRRDPKPAKELLFGPPVPHGHPLQSPTKHRPTFEQSAASGTLPGAQTASHELTTEGHRSSKGCGGAADETAGTAAAMKGVTAALMNGALPAHTEHTHV
jgi:hypothetical protein|eukprot:3484239-Prymnesium_polylepis.1